MKTLGALVCLFISSCIGYAQEFDLELLSDTLLSGIADPQVPIIFHFDANNLGEETFLVDMIREETDIPNGWEISLCTEACFPPEVTEAVFFLDEMATDEVSVHFFTSTAGSGMTRIRFTNEDDSTNTFEYDLYVETEPVGIEEPMYEDSKLQFTFDGTFLTITSFDIIENEIGRLINANGVIVKEIRLNRQNTRIDLSTYPSGLYIVQFYHSRGFKIVLD